MNLIPIVLGVHATRCDLTLTSLTSSTLRSRKNMGIEGDAATPWPLGHVQVVVRALDLPSPGCPLLATVSVVTYTQSKVA